MAKRDYYAVLEVEKTCSAEELKKAYRKKAVQFHPEFKSKPTAAHPLFSGFVAAAVAREAV